MYCLAVHNIIAAQSLARIWRSYGRHFVVLVSRIWGISGDVVMHIETARSGTVAELSSYVSGLFGLGSLTPRTHFPPYLNQHFNSRIARQNGIPVSLHKLRTRSPPKRTLRTQRTQRKPSSNRLSFPLQNSSMMDTRTDTQPPESPLNTYLPQRRPPHLHHHSSPP